ncbi:MAG: TolC family protein, partial [Candidatus Hydrogenedentes bacterium]|nr:TolC family protein [Candidatus Hydrogenedentota bacterium]
EIAQEVTPTGPSTAETSTLEIETGIGGKLPTGLTYDLSFKRSDFDQDVNVVGGDNSTKEDRVALAVTQPLLRGAGIRVNRAEIRKAEAGLAISEAELHLLQQNTVADAIGTYWQLVGAYAALRVRESAVHTAEQLLNETQERNDLGASSELDVLTAQSAVARRQNDLIDAFADVGLASDRLKQALNLRDGDLLARAIVLPTSERPEVDLEGLQNGEPVDERVRRALERRPELHVKDAQQAIAVLTLRQRRNARYPLLDLTGRYVEVDSDSDFSGLLVGDSSAGSDSWSVGLKASVPIGNRRARAEYRIAERQFDQIQLECDEIRSLIDEDVRRASRQMAKSAVLVENARKTVTLEQARFKAEQERFLFGDSTAFHLIQVQDDLISEETRLALSETQLLAAMADLQRAEGTLLSDLESDTGIGAVDGPVNVE